jgi:hypothetical protein
MKITRVSSPGNARYNGGPVCRRLIIALASGLVGLAVFPTRQALSTTYEYVLTHHYDNQRTGWNPNESLLTPSNVNAKSFGLLHTVTLDDQVDAQPLVLSVPVFGGGRLDVAYVATENNTVYAIDADNGTVLFSHHLGAPVPQSVLPGQCNANGANLGINSTPVIDLASETLYLIAYTLENGKPVYRIHALDLRTLNDKVGAGVVVTASRTLTNGQTYTFNAAVSRQRPALLEANGVIYAAFGSFCDLMGNLSRGWVLGWKAGTLEPLPANHLTDRLSASPTGIFLSSIWMSGAGIAEADGNLFFVTANSDPSSYAPPENIQESVVEMSPDLTTILGLFTPSDQQALDTGDVDLGSGGVLLVPPQNSLPVQYLAFAAGKSGYVYLLNRGSAFGGLSNPNKVVQSFLYGACWCTASYYQGSDGIGRVVSSVGYNIVVFKLMPSGSSVQMVYEGSSATLSTGQDPGFFTTVSSNGTNAGTALIWGVTRPTDSNPATVTLVAFDNVHTNPIYSEPAGSWPNTTGNANIVPVVANGLVYVASYKRLAIFGLGGTTPTIAQMSNQAIIPAETPQVRQISGTIKRVDGSLVTLQTRHGAMEIDAQPAQAAGLSYNLTVGGAITARGEPDAHALFKAYSILRAKASQAMWPPDR